MLFDNLTIRLLGSDDFPVQAKQQAAADLTTAAREGALSVPIDEPIPLTEVARAHDRVDTGARSRVLVAID
jgi:NADPH2:quinone reductase